MAPLKALIDHQQINTSALPRNLAGQLVNWDIKNSICAAAERCSESTVRMFMEEGDGPLLESSGANLLHYAALGGNKAVVHPLMEREGAEVWARDEHGATVLHVVAMGGNEEVVRLLIERWLDRCAEAGPWSLSCGDMGGTVLDLALCSRSPRLERLLIGKGVDVFQRGTIGTRFIATGRE